VWSDQRQSTERVYDLEAIDTDDEDEDPLDDEEEEATKKKAEDDKKKQTEAMKGTQI